jgi:hypothetical protein
MVRGPKAKSVDSIMLAEVDRLFDRLQAVL